MRKIFAIAFTLLFGLNSWAVPDSLQQFVKLGNQFYKQGNYDSALVMYQKVLNSGWEAAQLYYNIGNVYFRKGNIAKAMLYYERAYRLDPTDENIRHNLEYARQFVPGNIESSEFFIKRWWRSIVLSLPADRWAVLSLILFAVMLVMAIVFWLSRTAKWRRISFWLGMILLLLSLLTCIFSISNKNYVLNSGEAIIMQSTSLRSSPSDEGTELYLLHPGVKVKVLSTNDGWYEVRMPNGTVGWLPKNVVEKI